jgi:hypothetical protein
MRCKQPNKDVQIPPIALLHSPFGQFLDFVRASGLPSSVTVLALATSAQLTQLELVNVSWDAQALHVIFLVDHAGKPAHL